MAEGPDHRTGGAPSMPPQIASTGETQPNMVKDVGKWHLLGQI
jgi:hypothetical protein